MGDRPRCRCPCAVAWHRPVDVYVLRPTIDDRSTRQIFADEFGSLSTNSDWATIEMFRTALRVRYPHGLPEGTSYTFSSGSLRAASRGLRLRHRHAHAQRVSRRLSAGSATVTCFGALFRRSHFAAPSTELLVSAPPRIPKRNPRLPSPESTAIPPGSRAGTERCAVRHDCARQPSLRTAAWPHGVSSRRRARELRLLGPLHAPHDARGTPRARSRRHRDCSSAVRHDRREKRRRRRSVEAGDVLYLVASERFSSTSEEAHDFAARELAAQELSLREQMETLTTLELAERSTLAADDARPRSGDLESARDAATQRERVALAEETALRYERIEAGGFASAEQLTVTKADVLEQRSRLERARA